MASIRLLLQIVILYDLLIHHIDVKSAYLNAPLDNEIYVDLPEDFEGENGNYVWKLKKSLYGLKQSGQTWNKTFHTYLTTQNFVQLPVDPYMYIHNVNNQISIILLRVDDILIASKTEPEFMQIKTRLNSRFKMTDLGKLSWFLGIQFECENNTIKMNQSRYIEKFSMADCKPCSTPCEMDITKTSDKVDLIDSKPYREIIDSLIYIMVATRLDICHSVTRLSQDLAKPNSFHLMKAKHILCYLKGTINQSITFKKLQKPLKLEGFCDADWANLSDRKNVNRFCFRLAENNPMISWKSKKQNSVALSICEVEFIAISLASQEHY